MFFGIALLAVLLTLRSLQGYVREMLGAARRIGEGDFSEQVPVAGHDEMAGLAGEFNRMSDRLSSQMDQLRRQRVEIENSVRRIGEAFASGLDRQALLAILVDTAVASCDADYGLVALSGHVGAEAEAGEATDALRDVALAAEQRALREGELIEIERGWRPRRRQLDGTDRALGAAGRSDDRGPLRAGPSTRPSATSSSTWSRRPPHRSRTSPCTSSSRSRRSPTISPASPTSAPSAT